MSITAVHAAQPRTFSGGVTRVLPDLLRLGDKIDQGTVASVRAVDGFALVMLNTGRTITVRLGRAVQVWS